MSSDTGTDEDGLAELIAERTGRDAEEIRRAADETYVQPLSEALEEEGVPADD